MDIDGFGEKQIELFFNQGWIRTVPDLYQLPLHKEKIMALPGFGEKSYKIISEGLEASKAQPFRRVMPSLGLDEIGHKVTEVLIDAGLDSIEKWIEVANSPDGESRLSEIHGIGPKTIQSFLLHFKNQIS